MGGSEGWGGGRGGGTASPSCQRARHRDMRLAPADPSAESGSDKSSGAPTHHRHTLRSIVTGSYCAPDRRIMAASASRRAHPRELTAWANMWCARGRCQQPLADAMVRATHHNTATQAIELIKRFTSPNHETL